MCFCRRVVAEATAHVLRKQVLMFIILAIVLVIAYVGGLLLFKGAGLAIHLLIIFAVISLIMHFVTGRRSV